MESEESSKGKKKATKRKRQKQEGQKDNSFNSGLHSRTLPNIAYVLGRGKKKDEEGAMLCCLFYFINFLSISMLFFLSFFAAFLPQNPKRHSVGAHRDRSQGADCEEEGAGLECRIYFCCQADPSGRVRGRGPGK